MQGPFRDGCDHFQYTNLSETSGCKPALGIMVMLLLHAILFFFVTVESYSQGRPTLNSIKDVIRLENQYRKANNILEFNLGPVSDIQYYGQFSRFDIQQCLTTCFGTDGNRASGALNILFSNVKGEWVYDGISVAGGNSNVVQLDVTNDGLYELYVVDGWCFGGYGGEIHESIASKTIEPSQSSEQKPIAIVAVVSRKCFR